MTNLFINSIICAGVTLISSCSRPVTKPGYNFSNIHTVMVENVDNFPGNSVSGVTVNKVLTHELIKMGLNVMDRSTNTSKVSDTLVQNHYDATLTCTITQYQSKRTMLIPIEIENKGSTVITTETEFVPVEGVRLKHGLNQPHRQKLKRKTVKEETVKDLGSVTRTKKIKTYDAVVSLNMQLKDAATGIIVWSSSYNYNSLQLNEAIERCITGGLTPFKKVMKPYL